MKSFCPVCRQPYLSKYSKKEVEICVPCAAKGATILLLTLLVKSAAVIAGAVIALKLMGML